MKHPPLPDDDALPALAAFREHGLANAIPSLGLNDAPVQLTMLRYHPGRRAAVEARAGQRHFVIKVSAKDPSAEVALHETLTNGGVANDFGASVPPLLAFERELRVFVIGWLDGPSVRDLVERGHGERAGELAALWFRRVALLQVDHGEPLDAPRRLERARKWAATTVAAEPALEAEASSLVAMLADAQPSERSPRLVNGGLYADHLLDLHEGPGVIDWARFGQGPLELDGGILLATIWRLGIRDASLAEEVGRAERRFIEATADMLDRRALAWHRAAELLRYASKVQDDSRRWPTGARHRLLREATRVLRQWDA